jgi:hypothetical protein
MTVVVGAPTSDLSKQFSNILFSSFDESASQIRSLKENWGIISLQVALPCSRRQDELQARGMPNSCSYLLRNHVRLSEGEADYEYAEPWQLFW